MNDLERMEPHVKLEYQKAKLDVKLFLLLKILFRLNRIWFDRIRIALFIPIGRTHFPVLFNELKSLDQTKNLFDGSTHRQIIDRDLSQILLAIDDE